MSIMNAASKDRWPEIDVSSWTATKRSLHLYAQMLGKVRVALSPTQPNWMFTSLQLTASGFTTGAIPCEGMAVEAFLDVFASRMTIRTSRGAGRIVELLPPRSVAEVYHDLRSAFELLNVPCAISQNPQELPDATPLAEDTRPAAYDPSSVQRWFQAATSTAGAFERWRSHFFGRSGIQLWWGAFDVALILFNGKHVASPVNRGYLMKYDLDAELMNVGLYLGDETTKPLFYGYLYPQPPDAAKTGIAPAEASWSASLGEWVLPYDTVRNAKDPDAKIATFLDAIYEICFTKAGWDRDALSYAAPQRTAAR